MDYAEDLLGTKAAAGKTTDYASDLLSTPAPEKPGKATKNAPAKVDRVAAAVDTLKDTPEHLGRALRGFWQGATDLPVGLVQLASKFGPDKVDEAVSEFIKTREADYQASRGDYADRADLGRLTGTVVASMPVGGKAAAATLPGRMVQGAKVGAVMGAVTPVDPDSENFALSKAVQIGGSAVAGAVAPPLVEGVIKGVGATVNAVVGLLKGAPARLTNKATQDAIESTLTVELQKNGVNFADLSRQARDSLILETQKALKAGGTLDDAAVARIADFQKLGMNSTQGQVSRDPLQFATERNIGKTEIGKPLADRFGEQNTQLIAAVDNARAATGGAATDVYDAGKSAMGALRADDEVARKAVKAAYDAAKAKLGMGAEVPMEPIAQRLGQVVDEVGAENIPAAVMRRLEEFGLMGGKQTKSFTIAEAEKLRKLVGNNMPGQRTPIDAALAPIKQSIDDAVNSLAGRSDLTAMPIKEMKDELNRLWSARNSAMQDWGKFKAFENAQKVRSENFSPVPGFPRVPGSVSNFPERSIEGSAAADEALAIAKQRFQEARALEVKISDLEGRIGPEAVEALKNARQMAAERFKKIESIPALTDMLKNKTIAPEDFVNTYVIKGSVDEVKTLLGQLPPGARRDVQASVIDWIKSKAIQGADDTATFSQAAYNKALDSIGKRNLDEIFKSVTPNGPNIIEDLRRIGRVAAYVQKAPVGAGVNYSSSATALIDMLDKVGRLPIVGAIAGKPGDIVRATQVARSLTPAAPVQQAVPFFTQDVLENAARSGGVVAPVLGAGAFYGATRP